MSTDSDDGREDIDSRFADIVARWDDPPAAGGAGRGDTSGEWSAPATNPPPQGAWRVPAPDGGEPPEDPLDEDEDFDPPPVSPLPPVSSDWPFYLALVGLVAGPLCLVWLVLVAPADRTLMWVAGGLTLAGFVTVVARQPRDRDPDDGDGARV